jgi:hypothetical protein
MEFPGEPGKGFERIRAIGRIVILSRLSLTWDVRSSKVFASRGCSRLEGVCNWRAVDQC